MEKKTLIPKDNNTDEKCNVDSSPLTMNSPDANSTVNPSSADPRDEVLSKLKDLNT